MNARGSLWIYLLATLPLGGKPDKTTKGHVPLEDLEAGRYKTHPVAGKGNQSAAGLLENMSASLSHH